MIDLGDGDDRLLLNGDRYNAFGDVEVLTGDGNDRVTGDGGFQSLKIDTGTGNDRVTIKSGLTSEGIFGTGVSGVVGDLNISTGPGHDRIFLDSDDRFLVRGKLRIFDNSGPTRISMHAVHARHGAFIATGNAFDLLAFNRCNFAHSTFFSTRGGDDFISLRVTAFADDQADVLLTGAGRDRIEYLTA